MTPHCKCTFDLRLDTTRSQKIDHTLFIKNSDTKEPANIHEARTGCNQIAATPTPTLFMNLMSNHVSLRVHMCVYVYGPLTCSRQICLLFRAGVGTRQSEGRTRVSGWVASHRWDRSHETGGLSACCSRFTFRFTFNCVCPPPPTWRTNLKIAETRVLTESCRVRNGVI